jgi:hypothetical protein
MCHFASIAGRAPTVHDVQVVQDVQLVQDVQRVPALP